MTTYIILLGSLLGLLSGLRVSIARVIGGLYPSIILTGVIWYLYSLSEVVYFILAVIVGGFIGGTIRAVNDK